MKKLYFRYGTMGSGKSNKILQVAYNYDERGMKVFLGKPSIDTKGNDQVVSRIGISRKIDKLIDKNLDIYKYIKENENKYQCILIDESQFLTEKQVDQLLKITINLDIPVICYGLRTNFLTKSFEGSKRLLEIAHTIEEEKTICDCGSKTLFNLRKINGKVDLHGEEVQIDTNESIEYIGLCAKCYYEQIKNQTK